MVESRRVEKLERSRADIHFPCLRDLRMGWNFVCHPSGYRIGEALLHAFSSIISFSFPLPVEKDDFPAAVEFLDKVATNCSLIRDVTIARGDENFTLDQNDVLQLLSTLTK